jgi:hypothetical protein
MGEQGGGQMTEAVRKKVLEKKNFAGKTGMDHG